MAGSRRGDVIDQMYAWVVVDPEDGNEGVPEVPMLFGRSHPALGADRARIESFRPIMQEIARELGQPVTLVRFEIRTELEVLEP